MKICRDCEFHKRGVVQMGPQQGLMDVCTNSECRDPVEGNPLPCQVARQQLVFCGFEAKYFKKKEEAPKQDASVIQLG